MTTDDSDKPIGDVDPKRAAEILKRAAEIDADLAEDLPLADLRKAALEAGIRPAAFERAVAEFRSRSTELTVSPASPDQFPPSIIYRAVGAGGVVGAAVFGLISLLSPPSGDAIGGAVVGGVGVLAGVATYLMRASRRSNDRGADTTDNTRVE